MGGKVTGWVGLAVLAVAAATAAPGLPPLAQEFKTAYARTDGAELVVGTGAVERRWRWTGKGLVTVGVKNTATGRAWANVEPSAGADWACPGLIGENTPAALAGLAARENDDEGFTSPHLELIASVDYPADGVTLQYRVWAYPGAPGLRTQVWLKRRGDGPTAAADGPAAAPRIERRAGRAYTPPGSAAAAPAWFGSMDLGEREVEYLVTGADPARRYILGASWWDWGGGGRRQRIDVTSLDGEAVFTAVPPAELPKYRGPKEPPATVAGAVDGGAIMGDTFRVFVRLEAGPNANVSELWLYEEGGPPPAGLDGDPRRLAELAAQAPPGFMLAAYRDGGTGGAPAGEARVEAGRVDYLPVAAEPAAGRRYAGYYNDTQHRNTPATPVLREEVRDGALPGAEAVDWANFISLESGGEGLVLLKESHKCVNQSGVDTGAFLLDGGGLRNTGMGLAPGDVGADRYRWCWASWCLVYAGGDDGRERAVKRFDRLRYPVRADRDLWTVMCTWGHSLNPRDGRNYATEKEVLPEMALCADLGIDMVLIDDGWQVSLQAKGATPDGGQGWKPHPQVYPEGWKNVVAAGEKHGLRLGLWGVAQAMPVEDMAWNFDRIGMGQLKLDFARLGSHAQLDEMMRKARDFILYTNHRCIMSWDTTENAARYGYYWAREYGNVHFMNRKPETPDNVVYIPWLALRDFWMLARYQNLNKWQLVIQNPEVCNRRVSDAWKHGPGYCAALALMGIPEFMALPRFYSAGARDEIRALLALYRKHRDKIFAATVYPIGDEPTNASWSGFQAWDDAAGSGYALVFRELGNTEPRRELALRFVAPGAVLRITDLRTGAERTVTAGPGGRVPFAIEKPADYLFVRLEPGG